MSKKIPLNVSYEVVKGEGVVAGACGSHDTIDLRITFDDTWDGLSKYATFKDAKGENPTVVILTTDKLVPGELNVYDVTIPTTAMAYQGRMSLVLTGFTVNDGNEESSATNTATCYLRVLPSDYELADDGSIDATLAQQLQAEIDDIIEDISTAQASAVAAAESEANALSYSQSASGSASSASASELSASGYAETSALNAATTTANVSASAQNLAQTIEAKNTTLGYQNTTYGYLETASGYLDDTKDARDTALGYKEAVEEDMQTVAEDKAIVSANKTQTETYKTQAQSYMSEANAASIYAESYAIGGTGSRTGEDTDNAKYYKEWVEQMAETLSQALKPKGTIAFSELPSVSSALVGDMYNINEDFTTTSDFKMGAGISFNAGTNVYKLETNKWDCLVGSMVTGIKGDLEEDYRTGDVNIEISDIIGVDDTPTLNSTNLVTSDGVRRAITQGGGASSASELPYDNEDMTYLTTSTAVQSALEDTDTELGTLHSAISTLQTSVSGKVDASGGNLENTVTGFTSYDMWNPTVYREDGLILTTPGVTTATLWSRVSKMVSNIRLIWNYIKSDNLSTVLAHNTNDTTITGAIKKNIDDVATNKTNINTNTSNIALNTTALNDCIRMGDTEDTIDVTIRDADTLDGHDSTYFGLASDVSSLYTSVHDLSNNKQNKTWTKTSSVSGTQTITIPSGFSEAIARIQYVNIIVCEAYITNKTPQLSFSNGYYKDSTANCFAQISFNNSTRVVSVNAMYLNGTDYRDNENLSLFVEYR